MLLECTRQKVRNVGGARSCQILLAAIDARLLTHRRDIAELAVAWLLSATVKLG